MPERIIDILEAVKIKENQRQRFAVAFRHAQRLADSAGQQVAVRQTGQRIEMRQAMNLRLVRLVIGNVAENADIVADLAVAVAHLADRCQFRVNVAVLAPVPQFTLPVTVRENGIPQFPVEMQVVMP